MNVSARHILKSCFFAVLVPLMMGCSVFGSSLSSDPVVATQQRHVQDLKAEVRNAERNTEEAELREKAAKNRLKAAEQELKLLQSEVKRRNGQ